MTSKLSWIAFVPFTLAAIAIKVIQILFLDANGTFMGLNSLVLSYMAIACALIVMLFAVIFCFADKKTSSVYPLSRNIFSGIIGLIIAVTLACDGANSAFTLFRFGTFKILDLLLVVLTVLCAIVFVVLGLNHFVGNGGVRGLAVFYLVPAVWSAAKLVDSFLKITTESVVKTDVTVLACYVFLTLFLFNFAVIVSMLKGKNAVKATFIYGMPAFLMLLSHSIYLIGREFYIGTKFEFLDNIFGIELALFALYIISFVIEVTACVRRKEEIEIIEGEALEGEYTGIEGADDDIIDALTNSVTNGNSPDKPVSVNTDLYDEDHLSIDDQVFIEVAQNSMESTDDFEPDVDASDFIYGAVPSDDEYIVPDDINENDEQITESVEGYITKEDSTYNPVEYTEEEIESQMDRIDRLILEITDENK